MLEQIIAALKAKFPKLSDARISKYAEKLSTKITDEKDIDSRIDDLNDVVDFEAIIKQDAKIAKLEQDRKDTKKKKVEEPEDDEDDDEPAEPVTKKDRVPKWAKEMREELQALKSEKAQSTIKQKVSEKLKDVPALYWQGWALPSSEEEIDGFVEKVTKGYEGFAQDMTNKGFADMSKPKGGAGPATTKATDAEIKSILSKL